MGVRDAQQRHPPSARSKDNAVAKGATKERCLCAKLCCIVHLRSCAPPRPSRANHHPGLSFRHPITAMVTRCTANPHISEANIMPSLGLAVLVSIKSLLGNLPSSSKRVRTCHGSVSPPFAPRTSRSLLIPVTSLVTSYPFVL